MARRKQPNRFYLDFGNYDIKFLTASGSPGFFRHNLARLSDSFWRDQTRNGQMNPPEGIIQINGQAYAYGDAARRHQIIQKLGAERYQRDYYGVMLAIALAEGYKQSADNVILHATHAPRDLRYARDIRGASIGEWEIHSSEGRLSFRVDTVHTLDEPLGGLNHYTLTDSGRERRNNDLANATVLVVDVGGLTTDVVPVDPGMRVDVTAMNSAEVGAINIYKSFEEGIRSRYHEQFRTVRDVDQARLERALLAGVWNYGRAELDCTRQATESLQMILNDVLDIVQGYGGIANYDAFLLTGGGAVLLEGILQDALPQAYIELAEPNRDDMRYANVLGARKFFRLLEREGVI